VFYGVFPLEFINLRKINTMSNLFSPLKIRSIEFPNRIGVSPMCQYSATEGVPNDWHLIHLGTRAAGGAGLIIAEATAVAPEGRISPEDLGLWNDQQKNAFKKITEFISETGSVPGIQLGHAGKKASAYSAWKGRGLVPKERGGWDVVGPDNRAFDSSLGIPSQMNESQIHELGNRFEDAAIRAEDAGFQFIELHMAHGYLLHSFLSPVMNSRRDDYGGTLQNRMRFPLLVAKKVREKVSFNLPVFVRISCTDWIEGGWDLKQSIEFCGHLKEIGVDLIDCSSGGASPTAVIPAAPGYQVEFSEAIRRETGLKTAAVGLITEPLQAEKIIESEQADIVLLGREMLRNPYWALQAAKALNQEVNWPVQYLRSK
jgi:2,4-dienoyl-CoA reductase-like NADH-dependent reductase (Old Yellow Enzyme family)